MPFCHPRIKGVSENIGERLAGDKIENSLYKLSVLKQQPCKIVCRKKITRGGAKAYARPGRNLIRRSRRCSLPARGRPTPQISSKAVFVAESRPLRFSRAIDDDYRVRHQSGTCPLVLALLRP